ncbi:unnamed protein product [Moneuplotes crassus]|uniref:Uncharacterized protein n=1 Tax=Euplotes crassus TaxID=5936 RepID=A0AAD1UKW0_EUPCR|nr:unnamed protein product [Moneuplotes crassus]
MGCLQAKEKKVKTNVYKIKENEKRDLFMIDTHDDDSESLDQKRINLRRRSNKSDDFDNLRSNTNTLSVFSTHTKVQSCRDDPRIISLTSNISKVHKKITSVDDINLLECSKFWRICEINVYADDYISGIIVKYCLPGGQTFTSSHTRACSLKKKRNFAKPQNSNLSHHNCESLQLEYHEFITKLKVKNDENGMTKVTLETNLGGKLNITGKKDSEICKIHKLDLTQEKKSLIGLQTFYTDNIVGISCYISEMTFSDTKDLSKENLASMATMMSSPRQATQKIKKIKKVKKVVVKRKKKTVAPKIRKHDDGLPVIKEEQLAEESVISREVKIL